MTTTILYKGWMSSSNPRRKRDETAILSPNRFFYRPHKHVMADKIRQDSIKYGDYVNIRMWTHYHKIQPESNFLTRAIMGHLRAEYREVFRPNGYEYTIQHIDISDNFDLLDELMSYHHQYVILEITYNHTEFDMISHEIELILLQNSIL